MKKVLIIDDDALVRMFLRQIISWEQEGYHIVGDARDGEEGLYMLQEFQPDMVITDVSMPVMNGIEFLKTIKEKGFQGGVIMLSCHEDFDYVKTAMVLGADEYILKNHLSAESLREVLHTVEKHMEKRLHDITQQDELVALAKKGRIEARKEVLQKLLENADYSVEEQKKLFETAHISGSFRQCAVVLAHLPAGQKEKKDTFYELCQQIAVSNHAEMIKLRERVCAFILNLTKYPSTRKQYEIRTALSQVIHKNMWDYLGIKLSSGASEVCSKAGAIARAVEQAEKALQMEFYGQGAWSYPDAIEMSETCPQQAENLVSELPYLIKLGDEVKLTTAWKDALQTISEKRVTPQGILNWLRRCDLSVEVLRVEAEYTELESFEYLEVWIDKYMERLREIQLTKTPENVSISIRNAVEYINVHFGESFSLGDIAAKVGLTPAYLSARFKQEMGMGFVEYLTEVRISQAQWLIKQNETDTIKSISEQAGFTDYRHFCKIFKKKVGYSPAIFRKKSFAERS